MGKGKLQLKRIEDKNSRHVTFSKRRGGLMKKAKELSVLCDVDLAVFVFSGKGKLYEFSTADSSRKILQHTQIPKETDITSGSAPTIERQINKGSGTNLLQTVQRYLEELKVEQLDLTEIPQIEHRLDAILHQLRMKKEKQLQEGNQSIEEQEDEIGGGPAKENEKLTSTGSSNRVCDNFHEEAQQPKPEEYKNPLPLVSDDMEEQLYDNTCMPLFDPQFYML